MTQDGGFYGFVRAQNAGYKPASLMPSNEVRFKTALFDTVSELRHNYRDPDYAGRRAATGCLAF